MLLTVPGQCIKLSSGDFVKLGRFEDDLWEVSFGWFSFGGNRSMCGWFLRGSIGNEYVEKPLLLSDLDDIYIIQKRGI